MAMTRAARVSWNLILPWLLDVLKCDRVLSNVTYSNLKVPEVIYDGLNGDVVKDIMDAFGAEGKTKNLFVLAANKIATMKSQEGALLYPTFARLHTTGVGEADSRKKKRLQSLAGDDNPDNEGIEFTL
jgi:hypothetical protein